LVRTWTKPESASRTAIRAGEGVGLIWSAGYWGVTAPKPRFRLRVTGSSQVGETRSGARGVRELPEQPGDHEGGLLADVDGVVADALERARHQQHRHCPFARVAVLAGLARAREALAVELVDGLVLAHEVLREFDVAQQERLLG